MFATIKNIFRGMKAEVKGLFYIYQINDFLFQSSKLNEEGIHYVDDLHIGGIIDLEDGLDNIQLSKLANWYLCWPITDSIIVFPDENFLKSISKFAYDRIKLGEKVLVHCSFGNNRSGLVVACILIWSGMNGEEAIEIVQSKNPNALSNIAFYNWLKKQRPYFL